MIMKSGGTDKKLKPIKIKKKHKSCHNCKHFKHIGIYEKFGCKLTTSNIPDKVISKGCGKYKKNKHLYF